MWENTKKWIIIGAVLTLFAGGTYVYTDSQDSVKLVHKEDSSLHRIAKPVDMENVPGSWNEVESEELLNEFFEGRIPGLALAREEGLTTTTETSASLPGRDGRAQIYEVWHGEQFIHFLYRIDLSALVSETEETEGIGNMPSLHSIHMEATEDNGAQTLDLRQEGVGNQEAVIYENRLYGAVSTPPVNDPWELNDFETKVEEVNRTVPTSLTFQIDGETYETEAAPVSYVYNEEANILKTFTTTGTYEKDGLVIEPEEVQIRASYGKVRMAIEDEDDVFNHTMNSYFKMDTGEKIPVFLGYDQEENAGTYEGRFQPLGEIPEELTLVVEDIHLMEDASYSFTVDIDHMDLNASTSTRISEKIGEARQTDIYLDSVETTSDQHMSLELSYSPHDYHQNEKLVGESFHPLPASGKGQEEPSSFVSVLGDNGQEVQADYAGTDGMATISFPTHNFQEASTLTVTVNQMVYGKEVDTTFDLKPQ
ncbi:hypothetical protein JF544_17290 [Halobacillus kuroshimensis]|uniref:Uncharacterized protein n=1 Tax=Halobacillus kuroshimensis TaxID=302481 RepID=A0ABS3E099_9BACI|nr:hypothetical protein [Halobacillus kuroshimensis]MBN8237014.1 hypothetical protein [Halobacillus kuroshimensis]